MTTAEQAPAVTEQEQVQSPESTEVQVPTPTTDTPVAPETPTPESTPEVPAVTEANKPADVPVTIPDGYRLVVGGIKRSTGSYVAALAPVRDAMAYLL